MAQFSQKHPVELTQLVGNAVANGLKTRQVAEQLAAGTLPGWDGPYQMPLETVRYYGKKERDKRAAKAISPTARDNPSKAVDDLARLLLSAAQHGLEAARPQIDNDPKALKEWGDALKTISALVKDGPPQDPPKPRRDKHPSDPLTARLTAMPTSPSPNTPSDAAEQRTEQHEAPTQLNNQPTQPTQAAAGFLRKPPFSD